MGKTVSQSNGIEALLVEFEKVEQQVKNKKKEKLFIADQLASLAESLDSKERSLLLTKVADLLSVDEMTERLTRLLSQNKVPLINVASFKNLLVQATRKRQLFDYQPEWQLNNKLAAYKFVDTLGIKRPKVYAFNKRLENIEYKKGTVLKPEHGSSSQGVFVLDQKGGAFEVRTGEMLSSKQELTTRAQALLNSGVIKKNAWFLEEFIGDFDEKGTPLPPVDLKFYCFFGEVGIVMEIERSNTTRYCEWLADGTLTETGIYEDKKFLGQGFTEDQISLAKKISRNIFAPFVRIDFIKGKNQFSFGEFTPRPGHFSSFNKEFDQRLGEFYLKAESRLLKSLIKDN